MPSYSDSFPSESSHSESSRSGSFGLESLGSESLSGEFPSGEFSSSNTFHSESSPSQSVGLQRLQKIDQAQQKIYQYLLSLVQNWEPIDVLAEFKNLFIDHTHANSPEMLSCLDEILFLNNQQEFRYTLKRSCYILINNWDMRRNHEVIQQLIALFSDPVLNRPTVSPTLKRLRQWLLEFADSSDFYELKLYAERQEQEQKHWVHHFASYLLVSQVTNPENSSEQRQAARKLSKQLREQFKFDLARYTTFSQSPSSTARKLKNPTRLGDRVLQLIKRIVLRRGCYSYSNVAQIFLSQTQGLTLQAFKQSLLTYLTFAIDHPAFVQAVQEGLSKKLETLYCDRDEQPINRALLLRTSKRLVDYLLTEDGKEPSPLFILLLSKGNALLLVIVLLKIVLICRHVRVHLETRVADIIRYYERCPEEDCSWVVDFLEILHITLTIYTENIQYTLVEMNYAQPHSNLHPAAHRNLEKPNLERSLETYRIFSQLRSNQSRFQTAQPQINPA